MHLTIVLWLFLDGDSPAEKVEKKLTQVVEKSLEKGMWNNDGEIDLTLTFWPLTYVYLK